MTKQRTVLAEVVMLACMAFVAVACTPAPPIPYVPSTIRAPGVDTTARAQTAQVAASKADATTAAPTVALPPTPDKVKTAQAGAASVASATVTPKLTLPPPSQLAALRDEIFLAGPPAFAIINHCPMPESLPPGERAATWTSSVDSGLLCLFGFGENETVSYEVRDAAGEVVDSSERTPDNLDGDPLASVKVMIGIGDKAPGTWIVKASAASGELSASFQAQATTDEGAPAVVLSLDATPPFKLGQSVNIAVYGLPDPSAPQLGVYAVTHRTAEGSNLKLHESAVLEPDAGADFVTLTFDAGYAPGEYCVVVQARPGYEPGEGLSTQGAARCFEVVK